MNLSQDAGETSSELLFVNFNQDATSLAVGTRTGYKLFPLTSLDHLEPSFEKESGEVCIIERLFSSSLVAMVELSNPRKLRVCHFKKNSEICTYSYPDTILAVRLNRQVMHTIRDTPKNPAGLCALSMDNDNGYIAYPGSNQNGEVQVFDAINLKAVAVIPAHDTALAALAFNQSGSKLATASTTGTVIRVFSIPLGEKLFEFRRGMKRFIHINCLSFSIDDMYLVTSSSTETVHVFKLVEPPQEKQAEEQQGWMGYIGKAVSTSVSYLPSGVADAFTQSRAFSQLKLPRPGLKSVCTVACIDGVHRVLVATSDGILYSSSIDPREGGECKINKEFRLIGEVFHDEESVATSAGLTGRTVPSTPQSYASIASQGTSATPPHHHTHPGSHDSHMTPPKDSPEHRLQKLALANEGDEEDEKPPSSHSVHT